jgi:hypothetical protein
MTHTGNKLSLLRAYDIAHDTPTETPSFLDLQENFTMRFLGELVENPSITILFYLGVIMMRILL